MAQERVARAGHAVLKWLAGIAASVIAGVLLWQLTDGNGPPAPAPQNPTEENEPAPPAVVCHVDGAVYDKDTNQPLAGIEVHYLRSTQDPNEFIHGVRSRLATTAPDGRFGADCSSIEPENFSLRLEPATMVPSKRLRASIFEHGPRLPSGVITERSRLPLSEQTTLG
jgi:hypothetical protein